MLDNYTWHLWQLSQMTDEELRAIPSPEEMTGSCKERVWLHGLVKEISPDGRYVPIKIPKKGGEAIIILAKDVVLQEKIIIKVALPTIPPPEVKQKEKPRKLKPPGKPDKAKIIKEPGGLLRLQFAMQNKSKEKKKKRIIKPHEKYKTEDTEHFRRAFHLQGQLHMAMIRKGLQKFGYIPNVYTFSEPPKLWYSMEYINGEGLISWCQRKSDVEVLEMFLNIVRFVEECLHNFATVHSDIAPKNIMVLNGIPVLLDFGIAKCLNHATITHKESQLGTPGYGSKSLISDSRNRSYKEDISLLIHTFWIMWNRDEPDWSALVVRHDKRGQVIYDAEFFEAQEALYHRSILPLSLRYIYEKAINEEYDDISLMRADVERALHEMQPQPVECSQCDLLLEQKKRLDTALTGGLGILKKFFPDYFTDERDSDE